MLDKKTLRTLYVALALCLVVRVGFAIYSSDADIPREARANVRIGQCFADGRGFAIDQSFGDSDPTAGFHLTAYRNPIYPTFLGVVFLTLGEEPIAVGVVQSLADTLTCFLLFLFTLRMLGRPKAALLAAIMYAAYPPAIMAVALPMPETLATLVTLLASYTLMRAFGEEPKAFVLPGVLMGLLILLRPAMILFPLAVVLMMLNARRRVADWLKKAIVYGCAAIVIVSPWTIRNFLVFHTFIPVAAQAGNALWGGTGPADGKCLPAWNFPVDSVGAKKEPGLKPTLVSPATYMAISDLQDSLSQMSEPDIDSTLLTEAVDEISRNPGRWGLLLAKKLVRMWFGLWDDVKPGVWNWVLAVINGAVFVAALLGYRRAKSDYRVKLVAIYMIAYVTIVSVITYCNIRYSLPVMPLVIVLAASQLASALDGGSSRGRIVIEVR